CRKDLFSAYNNQRNFGSRRQVARGLGTCFRVGRIRTNRRNREDRDPIGSVAAARTVQSPVSQLPCRGLSAGGLLPKNMLAGSLGGGLGREWEWSMPMHPYFTLLFLACFGLPFVVARAGRNDLVSAGILSLR